MLIEAVLAQYDMPQAHSIAVEMAYGLSSAEIIVLLHDQALLYERAWPLVQRQSCAAGHAWHEGLVGHVFAILAANDGFVGASQLPRALCSLGCPVACSILDAGCWRVNRSAFRQLVLERCSICCLSDAPWPSPLVSYRQEYSAAAAVQHSTEDQTLIDAFHGATLEARVRLYLGASGHQQALVPLATWAAQSDVKVALSSRRLVESELRSFWLLEDDAMRDFYLQYALPSFLELAEVRGWLANRERMHSAPPAPAADADADAALWPRSAPCTPRRTADVPGSIAAGYGDVSGIASSPDPGEGASPAPRSQCDMRSPASDESSPTILPPPSQQLSQSRHGIRDILNFREVGGHRFYKILRDGALTSEWEHSPRLGDVPPEWKQWIRWQALDSCKSLSVSRRAGASGALRAARCCRSY